MSQAARKIAAANSYTESAPAPAAPRAQKTPVFLVTQDEALWPQIGPGLDHDFVLKQVDTLDELKKTTREGQAGIIVWDARDRADSTDDLSGLQLHSARFAIIVLDAAANTEPWREAIQQRQIVALLALPFDAAKLLETFVSAREEYHVRSAVLGEAAATAVVAGSGRRKFPVFPSLIAAAIALSGGVAYLLYRGSATPSTSPSTQAAPAAAPLHSVPAAAPVKMNTGADEQVDSLLEKARQAMLDRHFIEPADGNALAFYQNALIYDPNNGEARQGVQRLAQILFARVQSDLDERKFDVALQALETARGISPGDARLTELDARIATLRAELGPAQIQAAINAKNFDRAAQLLDEAARAKSLSSAKLNQLRDELRRRQGESDVAHIVKLLETRLQQDRLLEPRNDSAVYYLQQARQAGATQADLQDQTQTLSRKLLQEARPAIDQHRLDEADRMLTEARSTGGSPQIIAALQRDLSAARDNQAHEKVIHAQLLDLAHARLARGDLVEPVNDNALFYVGQLRAADPSNPGLAQITSALQSALILRARASLDAGDSAKAETLAKSASSLGNSAELNSFSDLLAQQKQKQSSTATVSPNSLVAIKPMKLEYPAAALAKGTEGWVDLAFDVTTEGKVAHVTVVDSLPHNVFDAEAKAAVSRVRYQPVLIDGHPSEIKTTLHVVFRLAKQ